MANIKEIDDALEAKKKEIEKEKTQKKIKKMMELANRKANEILVFLEKGGRSVRWTELFLQQLSGSVDSAFLNKKITMKVKDLDIKVQIPDKDENDAYLKVLGMIKDLKVIEATNILEGMNRVIDGKMTQKKNNQQIKELEITFTSDEQPKTQNS
jgi:hypothetical protein